MKTCIAYCFRSGHIEFANSLALPAGAIPIIRGDDSIRTIVLANARMSYPSTRGGDDEKPLVPGVPEAKTDEAALEALEKFCAIIQSKLPKP